MKIWLVYITVFICCCLTVFFLINAAQGPEKMIIGEWKEMEWTYEKVNRGDLGSLENLESQEIKKIIGQSLIIHQAEDWIFMPNGELKLIGNSEIKTVNWSIKGRGNILHLKYQDDAEENYIMTKLTESKLELNFESEIQARGIAKLTFTKTK